MDFIDINLFEGFYYSKRVPIKQFTETFRSVSLNDSLSTT